MKLRFPGSEIAALAKNYLDAQNEKEKQMEDELGNAGSVKTVGYLTKEQLQLLAQWKSLRSAGRIKNNSDFFVKEITGFALSTGEERARIEALTVLDGVGWPTASVILHFFHRDPFPILDFRALWSIGVEVPNEFKFRFWWDYTQYCRILAEENHVDMRTLDRALWQYSKENQTDNDN